MTNFTTRFTLGQLVATPAAITKIRDAGSEPRDFLRRHLRGDGGDLCEEDKAANDEAIETGERLLSSYRLSDETVIWIITDAGRSSTCILLPEEY